MLRTLLLMILLTLATSASANEPTLPWTNGPPITSTWPQPSDADWQDFAGLSWGRAWQKHPHPNHYDWCQPRPGAVTVCEVNECPMMLALEVTEPVWAAPVWDECKMTFVFYRKRLVAGIITFLDEYQEPDAEVNANLDLMYWNGYLASIYGTPTQHFETAPSEDSLYGWATVAYGWSTDWRIIKTPGTVGDWVRLQRFYIPSEGYHPLTQIFFVGYRPVYPQALVPFLPF